MSYNQYNRQDPLSSWSVSPKPYDPTGPNTAHLPPDSGFRNPWYHINNLQMQQNALAAPLLGLLHSRKLYSNQLPTTYENADQTVNNAPFINPPTRADNPFNQYYTNREVSLNNFPDRRMSAAVDGSIFNPYAANQQQLKGNDAGQAFKNAQSQPVLLNMAAGNPAQALPRRLSVATGATLYQASTLSARHLNVQLNHSYPQVPTLVEISHKRITPNVIHVRSKNDLKPKFHKQPKYRRRSVDSMHISPANALTVFLTESYAMCQPQKFRYCKTSNPKRVLTKPSEPKSNNDYDNEDSDYILYVNDILGTEEGRKYVVLDLLGSGTFGQVVKCQNLANQSVVAVKVVKSKLAFLNQSLSEVKVLEFLNQNSCSKSFIRLLDTFMHKEHLCLVFELFSLNLYELIKKNHFHGLNMKLVKSLTRQLLEACAQLKNFLIIHCDLKPENILLCLPEKLDIKVIDFGSACFTRRTIYSYIQSRFYRSPEVILGLPYTESIDMWSFGCIVGELFLGLPMFPGSSEYNQMCKIVNMLGLPPRHMLEHGKNLFHFFEKIPPSETRHKPTYRLKTYEEYRAFVLKTKGREDGGKGDQPKKNYFEHRYLRDIILNFKMPTNKMTQSMVDKEIKDRHQLVDFLTKVLNINPLERLTPLEALKHPFVNESYIETASLASVSLSKDPH
ncbi:kinase-like protein [Metschnikowia bicuspidata]|uniref:Kinase-like protein n=1 Tax=Metschnikowia bicuspidata TaxID=27322 RepID=A0A4P9ZC13_9ASCO|nr:kinase-like protein [Metschnikowia bicuspidata]